MISCPAADMQPFIVEGIVQAIRTACRGLADVREEGNKQRYAKEGVGPAAFSVLVILSASFRSNSRRMFIQHDFVVDDQASFSLLQKKPSAGTGSVWFILARMFFLGIFKARAFEFEVHRPRRGPAGEFPKPPQEPVSL